MDELDPIRELVVEAMAELEQALIDGLPAQAPRSGGREIETALKAFSGRVEAAARKIAMAEQTLRQVG